MGFKEKIDGKVWNIHSKSSFLDLANFVTYLTPMPIGYAIKFYKDTSMVDLACGPNNNRHYAMSVCKLALMAKAGKIHWPTDYYGGPDFGKEKNYTILTTPYAYVKLNCMSGGMSMPLQAAFERWAKKQKNLCSVEHPVVVGLLDGVQTWLDKEINPYLSQSYKHLKKSALFQLHSDIDASKSTKDIGAYFPEQIGAREYVDYVLTEYPKSDISEHLRQLMLKSYSNTNAGSVKDDSSSGSSWPGWAKDAVGVAGVLAVGAATVFGSPVLGAAVGAGVGMLRKQISGNGRVDLMSLTELGMSVAQSGLVTFPKGITSKYESIKRLADYGQRELAKSKNKNSGVCKRAKDRFSNFEEQQKSDIFQFNQALKASDNTLLTVSALQKQQEDHMATSMDAGSESFIAKREQFLFERNKYLGIPQTTTFDMGQNTLRIDETNQSVPTKPASNLNMGIVLGAAAVAGVALYAKNRMDER